MEILARVVLLTFHITIGLTIENIVSLDRNVPEHVEMTEYENYPVQDELSLLLCGNFDLAVIPP
jgi:hypothetical protein